MNARIKWLQKAKGAWAIRRNMPVSKPCFCTGPQMGQPLCPCRMKNVKIEHGRYVEIVDHGPAPEAQTEG